MVPTNFTVRFSIKVEMFFLPAEGVFGGTPCKWVTGRDRFEKHKHEALRASQMLCDALTSDLMSN